jgi:hypothetical protein
MLKQLPLLSTIVQLHLVLQVYLGFVNPGNTKGGSITVPLTSCLTGLESAV